MFISVRAKFLFVMSLLLGACVVISLVIAVQVFKSDKTALVFDLNRSQVSTLASEIESNLEGVSNKFKLFALLNQNQGQQWTKDLFAQDDLVVFVSLYRPDGTPILKNSVQKKYLEAYGITQEYFKTELPQKRPVPFDKILKNGEYIWNASISERPPLVGFGRSVIVEDERGRAIDQWAVVGYIKVDRWMKAISDSALSDIMIASAAGEMLLHPDIIQTHNASILDSDPFFVSAAESPLKTSVIQTHDGQSEILGAYSKSRGVVVIAKSRADEVFKPLQSLIERSLIFALIIITAAFLAAILLSRSLTQPLQNLVERMLKVSEGDLTSKVVLNTRDETSILAGTFNKMIDDLKNSRDQLEEMNRELDQKVKDRTQQLEVQNRAVKEAQEALLRTTRLASVGEVAGKAAHEVLNPLTSLLTRVGLIEKKIKQELYPTTELVSKIQEAWQSDYQKSGFSGLVESWQKPSELNPEQNLWDEDMTNISSSLKDMNQGFNSLVSDTHFLQQEGARITKIINSMRKLSAVRSEKQKHPMAALVRDSLNIMKDLLDQAQINVDFQVENAEASVLVDKDEFLQAMTNMLRNSYQALRDSEQPNKKIRLVSTVIDAQVHLYLEDNGHGVLPENTTKLFESSFSTKSIDEGTGLGLGISRRFIRSFGGDIEFVSSEPLKSTIFRIKLPLAEQSGKGVAA